MFQPFVNFKAMTDQILKKIKTKETNVIVTTQPNGWMDYELLLKRICKVLVKYTKGRHTLLVFDTYKDHLKEEVLTKILRNK